MSNAQSRRKQSRTHAFVLVLLLAFHSYRMANAQTPLGEVTENESALGDETVKDAMPRQGDIADRWTFDVNTSGWFPTSFRMSATTEVGSFSQRLSLNKLLTMYRGGGLTHLTARKGRYGLFADLSYGNLEDSNRTQYNFSPIIVNFPVSDTIQCGILQAGGLYRFMTEHAAFDVLAGMRYLKINAHFVTVEMHVNSHRDFVEPVIGGNADLYLAGGWTLSARVSVSGFGIASKLTTDAESRITYAFSDRIRCFLGYRVLDTQYQQDAGNLVQPRALNFAFPPLLYSNIGMTAECTAQGPVAGVEFRW